MESFKIMRMILISVLCLFAQASLSQSLPDWSEGAVVPDQGRKNPFEYSEKDYSEKIRAGYIHALKYPVTVTGLILPERPLQNVFDNKTNNPFRKFLNSLFKGFANVKRYEDLFRWVGLHSYPGEKSELNVPFPESQKPDYLMGYSRFEVNGVKVFTLSCAGCHSSNLFGDKILGMTNRFPRANHFFIRGMKVGKMYNPHWFRIFSGATKAETEITDRSVEHLKAIGARMPMQLGLDTSLAQVALSLDKREPTAWAERSEFYEQNPRPDILDQTPGDSKPAVWWNLKYKNRWLSDGSVISGNPIYTNILWNEIGRGTDLHELDQWFRENEETIKELTTAAFSTEAPRIEKYFSETQISPERAMKGEVLFNQMCSKCHGTYTKAWSLPEAGNMPWKEQIKTIQVNYPKKTRVIDVGTDPNRYLMMKSLEKLNGLAISEKIGVKIAAQKGYVPPPLVGIWARWPYFHNNSVPSLCEVLTPANKRAKIYYAGAALDKKTDFDFECNGYPVAAQAPVAWKTIQYKYDTSREAMSNRGHDDRIFVKDGQELLSADDKRNLIQFLQTL
jgi:hypothetical protein